MSNEPTPSEDAAAVDMEEVIAGEQRTEAMGAPTPASDLFDGRYRMLHKIGSGGMATVWLAEDTQLRRKVAIKRLDPRLSDNEQFLTRFRLEAEAAGGLQHPNVVQVYDRGIADGTNYIAMEYVPGPTLADRIAEGMSPEQAVAATIQILDAAEAAHARGIIHRDLKPQNVLITADGRYAVADFGVAQSAGVELTDAGQMIGTASYLAPEQAHGQPASEVSDIYSIGVILYEALCGHTPFPADNPVAVVHRKVTEEPVAPSAFAPGVSPALDAVVLRALARDPGPRFQSAAAFRSALQAALADDAAPPPLAPMPGPLAPPSPSSKAPWIIGIVALLVAGAAAIFLLTQPDPILVPDLQGQELAAAENRLGELGLEASVEREPSDEPVDTVISQSPSSGAEVEEGQTVYLTVSSGPPSVALPDVAGMQQTQATAKLTGLGFEVTAKQRHSEQPKGEVLLTNPPAGDLLAEGSEVELVVSSGLAQLAVPDVVGLEEEIARSTLSEAGFEVSSREQSSETPAGEVLSQSPAGGRADAGSTVEIVVSSGPEQISVTDVIGLEESEATAELAGQGLSVLTERGETDDPSLDGMVINQTPQAGSVLEVGSSVTILVGNYIEPVETTTTPAE